MPSSVHVADVTHDICHAYERPASHGVSATANETNVIDNVIWQNSEGLSSVSMTQEDSRKRPGYSSIDSFQGHPSKRIFQGNNDVAATISEAAITCLSQLTIYVEETSRVTTELLKNAYSKINDAKEGMSVVCIELNDFILLFQSNMTSEHLSRSIWICA